MLNKIILGTANFTQAYGILSEHKCLNSKEVNYILAKAIDQGLCTIDTALSYGDLTEFISSDVLKKLKIITKISALDDENTLLKKMNTYKGLPMHGLLVHDPSNIVNESDLNDKLDLLKQTYGIEKIGVSAYDIQDIESFSRIRTPEIVQIPMNPLNQSFDSPSFIEWAQNNKIEVHARSLFLQGVLLSETLPQKLEPLSKDWIEVKRVLQSYPSPLHGLMAWAGSKNWIHNWVLGVSSSSDLDEILEASSSVKNMGGIPLFQASSHPLADPRNW